MSASFVQTNGLGACFAYIPFGDGPHIASATRSRLRRSPLLIARAVQQLDLDSSHPVVVPPGFSLRAKERRAGTPQGTQGPACALCAGARRSNTALQCFHVEQILHPRRRQQGPTAPLYPEEWYPCPGRAADATTSNVKLEGAGPRTHRSARYQLVANG